MLRKWLCFVPTAPVISTSKFSGVLITIAKFGKVQHSLFLRYSTAFSQNTCFRFESGFLSFLELQKSLLVGFQGCWTQWQRFESSNIHHLWDAPQHFLKTHFWWGSGFVLFLQLQKSLLVGFQGYWTQWQRFESSSIHCFWDTPLHFLKTHVLALKVALFCSYSSRNPY